MKSIKDLYLEYKRAKSDKDRMDLAIAFEESVISIFETTPKNLLFHPDLEYIISSKIGMESFNNYIEKYGLPIAEYNRVLNLYNKKLKECDQSRAYYKDKNKTIMHEEYADSINKLNRKKNKYEKCFAMFENYKDDCNYTQAYYEYAYTKKPNVRKLLDKYGLGAIPDVVIYNNEYIHNDYIIESILNNQLFKDANLHQWLYESISGYDHKSKLFKLMREKSLDNTVKNIYFKSKYSFLESIKYLDGNYYNEITNDDKEWIRKYIDFKENLLNYIEDLNEKDRIIKALIEADNMLNSMNEDSCDLVEYLPMSFNENLFRDTKDKQVSSVPDYIKKNHDVANYGETDDLPKDNDEDDDSDDDIESYKKTPSYSDDMHSSQPPAPSTDKGSDGKSVNYYYYTYNNSFNKHRADDNSVTYSTSADDNSVNYSSDDNSVNYDADDNSVSYTDTSDNNRLNYVDKKSSDKTLIKYGSDNKLSSDSVNYSPSKNFKKITDASKNKEVSTGKVQNSHKNDNSLSYSAREKIKSDLKRSSRGSANRPKPTRKVSKESYDFFSLPLTEEVGSADDSRPQSDNPLRDGMMDIHRAVTGVKNNIVAAGKAVGGALATPGKKIAEGIQSAINFWKNKSEQEIKEELADPSKRFDLYANVRRAINLYAWWSVGLWNPLMVYFQITRWWNRNAPGKIQKLRAEMEGELKTEIKIVKDKIQLAEKNGDTKAKYQLMRFENELNKKLKNITGMYINAQDEKREGLWY